MPILKIARMGHPVLAKKAQPVMDPTAPMIRRLVNSMVETMIDANGAGLAAPQVHVPLRVVVFQAPEGRSDGLTEAERYDHTAPLTVLINPEIVERSDEASTYEEGCLSIPDYYAEVERPAGVKVRYLDRQGKERMLDAEGLLSTCVQHEIDHLDGVLFIDHISKLKRDMVVKKFRKLAKEKVPNRMVG